MNNLEAIISAHPIECGACQKCCKSNPGIQILPEVGDDPDLYEGYTEVIQGQLLLKRQSNGDCIYLDSERGCTNYENRPSICRSFDCRRGYVHWMGRSRKERQAAKKSGQLNPKVQLEGEKQLQRSLDLASGGSAGL